MKLHNNYPGRNLTTIVSMPCLLFFASLMLLGACNRKLDLAPVSSITDANYWKTPEHFDAFVAGLHVRLRSQTLQLEYLGELRADVFGTDPGSSTVFTGEATQGFEAMWLNNLNMDLPGVADFGGFYASIVQINLLINKLNSTTLLTAANKNHYLGIAHGLRAFYYFHLYRSWGSVIIQTEPTTSVDISNLAMPASSEAEVMALIKSDIDLSLTAFGSDYSFRQTKSFWSRSATLMLKAEVYLWTSYRGGGTNDATTAKNALTEIQTNVPGLTLLSSFANVFASTNKGNAEIIFAIRNRLNESALPFDPFYPQTSQIVNYYDSVENRKFNAVTDNWGNPLRIPTKIATFRKFNDLDTRKWTSIQPAYTLDAGTYKIAGAFVKKFPGEQNAGTRVFTNDYPVYRYADLLLLLAEAKHLLGESPATEINLVRSRAFGANYNPALHAFPNQPGDSDIKLALLQERFFEFIHEGKRWYDLRRFGDNYVHMFTNIPLSEAYKLLWPIDRNSLTNNRELKQTPGYPGF